MRSRVVTGIAVVTAVAAGGVGGALIGVPGLSGAQPFPTAAVSTATAAGTKASGRVRGDSALLDAAAKALKLTTQQLTDKLSDGKTTIADVAKQQNVDIKTVISAMTAADSDRISNIVNEPWPKFPSGPRPGPGVGLPALRGKGRLGAVALDPAAKALGISSAELKTDLANGQTIAQIAKSKNIDVNKVIDALVADESAKIDAAVKAGHLSKVQGDNLKSHLKAVITMTVNNAFPKGPSGGGFGGRFGFPGRGGVGGPPSAPKPPTS